jgi:hypothetical protein
MMVDGKEVLPLLGYVETTVVVVMQVNHLVGEEVMQSSVFES